MPSESFSELEEVNVEEDFTINNEFPVFHPLTDGTISKIVLNQVNCYNSDDEDSVVNPFEMCLDVKSLLKKYNNVHL